LVGLSAAAKCSAQEQKEQKATATVTVRMTDGLKFKPARITIHAGDTVKWQNTSSFVHTVTADAHRAPEGTKVVLPSGAGPFDSGNIKPGDSYRHTFTMPGTYKYICVPHAELGMTGEVIVEPRAATTAHPHTEAPPQPPHEAMEDHR
jgi:plastocyanin